MRLLVCGPRLWSLIPRTLSYQEADIRAPVADAERDRTYREIAALAPTVVIHGAASGADTTAASCAVDWAMEAGVGCVVKPYPADWARDGRAAGPIRNERMLREGKPDRGLAFGALWVRGPRPYDLRTAHIPDPHLWKRSGTGGMVSIMLHAGLPVRWVAAHDAVAVDLVEMPEAGR